MKTKLLLSLLTILTAVILIPIFSPEKRDIAQGASSNKVVREYKIGSGDVLNIMTWKEPDLTRATVLVRIDGKISFSLLFLRLKSRCP